MAEDTETQLIERRYKKIEIFRITTGRIYRYSEQHKLTYSYARYIDHDESEMKEDILSVSELPAHTTSSKIFRVLNGFIEERVIEWKNCLITN
jgi:hypothetical protein